MEYSADRLFHIYAKEWVDTYKLNDVRKVTVNKYYANIRYLKEFYPELKCGDLTSAVWQRVVDDYARERTIQTVRDFHSQFKAMLRDLVYEDVIPRDPTHRVKMWGGIKYIGKEKFLSLHEVKDLISVLNLNVKNTRFLNQRIMDWMIYVALKTGLRFSEIIAITPSDVDINNRTITVNKTWNYKTKEGGYDYPKSRHSVRTVDIDPTCAFLLNKYITDMNVQPGVPLFLNPQGRVFNSTINDHLSKQCKLAGVPAISFHSLRHTYASLLIANGVSVLQTSKWLGHADTVVTQRVYTHVTEELNSKDIDGKDTIFRGF